MAKATPAQEVWHEANKERRNQLARDARKRDVLAVQRRLGDIKRFPHRIAGEHPEEWLCRVLTGLSEHLRQRGLSGPAMTDAALGLTVSYSLNYLEVAQEALRTVLLERMSFLRLYAVEDRVIVAQLADANQKLARVETENALLRGLVNAKTNKVFLQREERQQAYERTKSSLVVKDASSQRRQAKDAQEPERPVGGYMDRFGR